MSFEADKHKQHSDLWEEKNNQSSVSADHSIESIVDGTDTKMSPKLKKAIIFEIVFGILAFLIPLILLLMVSQ